MSAQGALAEHPQEVFWRGEFGDAYTARNTGEKLIKAKASLFAEVFLRTGEIGSVFEVGANRGLNLLAIHSIQPDVELAALEINRQACEEIQRLDIGATVFHGSALEFTPSFKSSLSFTMGLLIHIPPADLERVYRLLYDASEDYILIAEYYSPTPVEVEYRGSSDRLWKRDFSGEIMRLYPHLRLVDYGFRYRRDAEVPLDDITWFLMEKR